MNCQTTNTLYISEGVSTLIEKNLQLAAEKSEDGRKAMKLALSAIVDAMDNIHKMSTYIVLSQKSDFDLVNGIKKALKVITPTNIIKINCQFSKDFSKCMLTDDQQICLYRIVQEQVNNIFKHSHANNVNIQLTCKQNKCLLEIRDDGIGCHMSYQTKGVGLINITNRVQQFYGKTIISTSYGKGFVLLVELPITNYQNVYSND